MKPIWIYALVVTCLIVKGYSEPIHCYDCENCKELNDDMLELCPPDITTPSPSTEDNSSSETSSSADSSTTALAGNTLDDTEEANDITAEATEDHKARNSRQVNYEGKSLMTKRSVEDTISYQCFSIVKNGTEGQEIKKGCVEIPANQKGCDVLKEVEGVSEENCKVCSENKCNTSVGLKYSFVTVFVVSVVKAFL